MNLQSKLYAKIIVKGPNECWPWTGATNNLGRAQFSIKRKTYSVARLIYELEKGPIPEGKQVQHLCNNVICCNFNHLILGTNSDNMLYCSSQGRHAAQIGKTN